MESVNPEQNGPNDGTVVGRLRPIEDQLKETKDSSNKNEEAKEMNEAIMNKEKPNAVNIEQEREKKGLLGKFGAIIGGNKEKEETEISIELPRDILTAFFLLRLPRDASRGVSEEDNAFNTSYWDNLAFYGKVFLWFAVLVPYMVQWFVLFILLRELKEKWDVVWDVDTDSDFWYNTAAFSVLFLYVWKDLASFYFSLWRYVSWVQSKQGGILQNLKTAATETAHIVSADDAVGTANDAKNALKTTVKFVEFKIWYIV